MGSNIAKSRFVGVHKLQQQILLPTLAQRQSVNDHGRQNNLFIYFYL